MAASFPDNVILAGSMTISLALDLLCYQKQHVFTIRKLSA